MPVCVMAVVTALLLGASVTADETVCEVDAQPVVEHARKKGYSFETTRSSAHGTCERDRSHTIFIASATSAAAVACDVQIFSKAIRNTTPAAPAADTPAWSITSIRIAGPDASSIYAEELLVENKRGWTFEATASPNETIQYRIAKIEFTTTGKDCTKWRDAF